MYIILYSVDAIYNTLGPAQSESYNRMNLIGKVEQEKKQQNTYKLCMYIVVIYENNL